MKPFLFWVLPSVLFWIRGYFGSKDKRNPLDKRMYGRLKSPLFLYLLCGKPRNPEFPERIMVVNSCWQQVLGIFYLLIGFFLDKKISSLTDPIISPVIGFFGAFVLSGVLVFSIYKISPYVEPADRERVKQD